MTIWLGLLRLKGKMSLENTSRFFLGIDEDATVQALVENAVSVGDVVAIGAPALVSLLPWRSSLKLSPRQNPEVSEQDF